MKPFHSLRSFYSFSAALLAGGLLASCSGSSVRDTLGLNHSGPDEFRVVSRPALSVPPQFNLRPPGSTAGTAAQPPTSQQAEALITGNNATGTGTFDPAALPSQPVAVTAVVPVTAQPLSTNAESQFLKDAGAQAADPNVRNALAAEKAANEEKSGGMLSTLNPGPKPEPVVSAQGEAARIQTDKTQGKPVTTGDTPNVPQKDTGLLGSIFGY